jgi:universal stress protein A
MRHYCVVTFWKGITIPKSYALYCLTTAAHSTLPTEDFRIMITDIPINESHVFAFKITGKLEADDYKIFRPKLDKIFEEEGRPISLLIKLEDFQGWTAQAAWEDLKIGFKYHDDFLRIAIVGEKIWEKLISGFGDLFTVADVEYFENESDALDWIKEVENQAEQDEYIGYRHILVTTDFSKYADSGLRKALELAKPFNAKVTLMHAIDTLSSEMYPAIGELAVPVLANNPEQEKKHIERIERKLSGLIKELDYSEALVDIVTVSGHPVDAIIDYAVKNDNDLIVMGSHGRRGLARLLGSSTNGVINHAPCDVLTVVNK